MAFLRGLIFGSRLFIVLGLGLAFFLSSCDSSDSPSAPSNKKKVDQPGTPTEIVKLSSKESNRVAAFVVDDSQLYWLERADGPGKAKIFVKSMSRKGGPAKTLQTVEDPPSGTNQLWQSSTHLFWSLGSSETHIYRIAKTSKEAQKEPQKIEFNHAVYHTGFEGEKYYVTRIIDKAPYSSVIEEHSFKGMKPRPLGSFKLKKNMRSERSVISASHIYLPNCTLPKYRNTTGELLRVSKTGGPVEAVWRAGKNDCPVPVAADDTHVYGYIRTKTATGFQDNKGSGKIVSWPAAGGQPTVLKKLQGMSQGKIPLMDAESLVWNGTSLCFFEAQFAGNYGGGPSGQILCLRPSEPNAAVKTVSRRVSVAQMFVWKGALFWTDGKVITTIPVPFSPASNSDTPVAAAPTPPEDKPVAEADSATENKPSEDPGQEQAKPEEAKESRISCHCPPKAKGCSGLAASSVLIEPNKSKDRYNPAKAFDGNKKTAWSEGSKGSGIGEWIEISLAKPRNLKKIGIWPGFGSSNKLFKANGRLKKATVILDDGTKQVLHFKDMNKMQYHSLNCKKPVSSVRVQIDEVYPGKKYQDTCIAEIKLQ